MMYAKWIGGLLDVVEEQKNGYKPMAHTEPPEAPSGYHAGFFWKETDSAWEQTWEIVPDEDELDDAELVNILLGEGLTL